MATQPLTGIRVIDLTQVRSGRRVMKVWRGVTSPAWWSCDVAWDSTSRFLHTWTVIAG